VLEWRLERIAKLGVPGDDAFDLAASKVELRSIEHLLDHGCPPELVAKILL